MGANNFEGPQFVYGNLGNIEAGTLSSEAVPDPNQDAGPSMFYQGIGIFDPRVLFLKDKITGWTGMAPGWLGMTEIESVRNIPATHSATLLVNAVNPASVPFTLPTTSSLPGFACSVPVRNFSAVANGGTATTYAIALDYGFGYAAAPAIGSNTWTPDPLKIGDYFPGVPVCIVGQTASVPPLLTFITAVGATTFTTAAPNPGFTSAQVCAVGTGDLWGPNEAVPATGGFPVPLAASPYFAQGPGLLLDSRQTVARCLVYTGVASSSGGNITTVGADIYGMPMSETITLAAGANVVYGKKAFKYVYSITPAYTNGFGVSVGTSDQFGFVMRSNLFEDMSIFFAGTLDIASTTGYVSAVLTTPATALTGDVRGTIQVGTAGAGTGFGANLSNGTLGGTGGVVQAGNRLEIYQRLSVAQAIQAEQLTPYYLTGVTQA